MPVDFRNGLEIPRRSNRLGLVSIGTIHSVPIRIRMLFLRHSSRVPCIPTLLLHCSRHLYLGLLTLNLVSETILVDHNGYEIDGETPDIEGVDERNGPLDYCGAIVMFSVTQDPEGKRETNLNEYEGELDPEGNSEVAVLAVVYS